MKFPIKVLVVGQTPPPIHGQGMMIQMLVDGPINGVQLHHIRMSFSENVDDVGRFQFHKIFHLLSLISRIGWHRLRHGPTVLYYPPTGPNLVPLIRDTLLLLSTRWLFRKTVFHFQASGVSEFIPKLPGWFQIIVRRAFFFPDAAIQLSTLTVPDAAYVRAKKIYIVPNASDDHTTGREKISSPSDKSAIVKLIYLGMVCESKGILVLLDACQLLLAKGILFHLDIIGGFSPAAFQSVVQQTITNLGLSENVTIHGQKIGDEKWNMLASSDLFCFPTHYESEGFPCVLVEAMSFGLPIVSTRWRGIPSIVEDGVTGYLVETKDSKTLAERIASLIGDPQKRNAMGAAARARYEHEFSRERHLLLMEQVFHDIAD